jgi:hypothetical protein
MCFSYSRFNFREKLFLSLYKKKSIQILFSENESIKNYEINLFRLIDKYSKNSRFFLNEAGTILDFFPGTIKSGKFFHKTNTDRSLVYYLEFLSYVTFISKDYIEFKLSGLRSLNADFSLETFLYSIIPLYRNIAGRDIRIKTWTEKNSEKKNTNAIFFCPGNFSINRLEHELKNVIKSIRIIVSSSNKKRIDEEKVRAVIEKKFNFYNNDYKIYNFTVTNQNIHFDTVCLLYEMPNGIILGADYTTSSVENQEFYLNTIKYLSDFMITQDASQNSLNFFNHNFFIIRSLVENVDEDFKIKVKSLTLCNINLLRDVSKFLGIFYKFIPIAQSNILIVKVI